MVMKPFRVSLAGAGGWSPRWRCPRAPIPGPSAAGQPAGRAKSVSCGQNNGGSLEAIAKKYNVGFLALLQANPGVDPYVPRAGSVLTIPLQTLLPDAPREGLVINLAELRLYYYPPGRMK
jgi:L,D-transpeptidase YcfS